MLAKPAGQFVWYKMLERQSLFQGKHMCTIASTIQLEFLPDENFAQASYIYTFALQKY